MAGPEEEPEVVDRGLALLRGRLDVPIAFFSQVTGGRETVLRSDLDGASLDGASAPLAETICAPMLAGEVPSLIPDLREHDRLMALEGVRDGGFGAYVGVPVVLPDGEVFGTLCCLDHEARPDLRDRHETLVRLVADLLADRIAAERTPSAAQVITAQAHAAHALLVSLGERHAPSARHSEDVVDLAVATGQALGIEGPDLADLRLAALLHDVGKIGVPDGVLTKPAPLDDAEWDAMRRHPEIGARLVAALPSLAHLAPVVAAEHERWDGAGYPRGLAAEAIPLHARIILVCDAYDAMVADRAYRRGGSPARAMRELEGGAGTQFDPAVVRAFLATHVEAA